MELLSIYNYLQKRGDFIKNHDTIVNDYRTLVYVNNKEVGYNRIIAFNDNAFISEYVEYNSRDGKNRYECWNSDCLGTMVAYD